MYQKLMHKICFHFGIFCVGGNVNTHSKHNHQYISLGIIPSSNVSCFSSSFEFLPTTWNKFSVIHVILQECIAIYFELRVEHVHVKFHPMNFTYQWFHHTYIHTQSYIVKFYSIRLYVRYTYTIYHVLTNIEKMTKNIVMTK